MPRLFSRRSMLAAGLALAPAGMLLSRSRNAAAQNYPSVQGPGMGGAGLGLQANIDRLLAEHAAMGAVALAKQYDNAPDLQAVASEVDKNSMMIAGLIGSLYGADAQNAFLPLWRSHIDYYMQYTNGLKQGDSAAMAQAQQNLNAFVSQLTALMAGANPYLDPGQLSSGLTTHVDQTLAFVRSYAAGDYATAYAGATQAIDHMFMMGAMLARAIRQQLGGA